MNRSYVAIVAVVSALFDLACVRAGARVIRFWGLLSILCSSCSTPSASTSQYLLFQDFTGANDGTGVFKQQLTDQAMLKSALGDYVGKIQAALQPTTISIAADRGYGLSFGPLSLDQPDQELADTIKTGFDVAIEQKVAVGFHFDISHFWKNAKNADGTLLSAGTGADDVREWKDWSGTIADKDPWDGEPGTLPSMCFECDPVKALVDRVAGSVIAPALKAGLDRLSATGDQRLFAGAIVGWEAGSLNVPGYHSLTVKGYTSATSLADLNHAQQQILHDYLQRWTSKLVAGGVPKEKLYTHTSNFAQWDIDNVYPGPTAVQTLGDKLPDWLNANLGNGVDSFWDSFTDDANAGFSVYVNSAQEGVFEAIWAEAAKHAGAWGECEGTNVKIDGSPSEIHWETYLGKIFNHGGTLANVFGGFIGDTQGYGQSTESAEAVAAYQKLLKGETLQEAP